MDLSSLGSLRAGRKSAYIAGWVRRFLHGNPTLEGNNVRSYAIIEGKEKDKDVCVNASRKAKEVRSNHVTAQGILARPFLQYPPL